MARGSTLLAAIAFLTLGSAAAAATLRTAPVPAQAGNVVFCDAVNVGTRTMAMQLELRGVAGAPVALTNCAAVGPDQQCIASASAAAQTVALSCRIDAKGGKNAMRGAVYNLTTGSSTDAK